MPATAGECLSGGRWDVGCLAHFSLVDQLFKFFLARRAVCLYRSDIRHTCLFLCLGLYIIGLNLRCLTPVPLCLKPRVF